MILYYSLLQLNPLNQQVREDMQNPYNLHLITTAPFVGRDRDDCRVLWRLDGNRVLLQSTRPPNTWEQVLSRDSYLLAPPETKAINLNLTGGGGYRFRLVCNPAYQTHDERGKQVIVSLRTIEERRQWLEKRFADAGMQILNAMEIRELVVKFRKRDNNRVVIFTVLYDGLLKVTDPIAASEAVALGVGRGKAFGMGMISLSPVR